jgi:hypothetical protein
VNTTCASGSPRKGEFMATAVVYRITFEHPTACWVLRQDGNVADIEKYATKEAALSKGRRRAREKRGELVVHARDGSIESEITFGKRSSAS